MDPAGILMLGSIREVFDMLGIDLASVQFEKNSIGPDGIIPALTGQPMKCPVVTAYQWDEDSKTHAVHAMVAVGKVLVMWLGLTVKA